MSVYVIAEAGVNHDGDLDRALKLIDIAKTAGADAVKFQLFNASTCKGEMRELLTPLELSKDAHRKLYSYCLKVGIDYMASCFDHEQIDFVVELGCKSLKIGSGELTNHKLLRHAAESGLFVYLSTGMSTEREVIDAFEILVPTRRCLMHCVSAYPTATKDANLWLIKALGVYGCPVGYSDHVAGIFCASIATALGAYAIEKHFTDDCGRSGPDHHMSIEPANLNLFVHNIRLTEKMIGHDIEKRILPCEIETRKIAVGRWS